MAATDLGAVVAEQAADLSEWPRSIGADMYRERRKVSIYAGVQRAPRKDDLRGRRFRPAKTEIGLTAER